MTAREDGVARSWGATIRLLTIEERIALAQRERSWSGTLRSWGRPRSDDEEFAALIRGRACTMGGRDHLAEAEFVVSYHYITGRRGRVSVAERRVCKGHADSFARSHHLPLPEPTEP